MELLLLSPNLKTRNTNKNKPQHRIKSSWPRRLPPPSTKHFYPQNTLASTTIPISLLLVSASTLSPFAPLQSLYNRYYLFSTLSSTLVHKVWIFRNPFGQISILLHKVLTFRSRAQAPRKVKAQALSFCHAQFAMNRSYAKAQLVWTCEYYAWFPVLNSWDEKGWGFLCGVYKCFGFCGFLVGKQYTGQVSSAGNATSRIPARTFTWTLLLLLGWSSMLRSTLLGLSCLGALLCRFCMREVGARILVVVDFQVLMKRYVSFG